MKRILTVLPLVAALTLTLSGLAYGATGAVIPHGGYSSATDACLQCHDVHQAAGEYALTRWATVTDTCGSCHTLYLSAPGTLANTASGPGGTPLAEAATSMGYTFKSPASGSGSYGTVGVSPAYDPGYPGAEATPAQAAPYTAYKKAQAQRATHEGHRIGVGPVSTPEGDIAIPGSTRDLTRVVSWALDTFEPAYGSLNPLAPYNIDEGTNDAGVPIAGTNGLYCASCHTPHGNFGWMLPPSVNNNLLSSRPDHYVVLATGGTPTRADDDMPTADGALSSTGLIEIWDPSDPYATISERSDVSDWILEGGNWCAQCHDKRLFGVADFNGNTHYNHPTHVCLDCHGNYNDPGVTPPDFPHTGVGNLLTDYPDLLCIRCHTPQSLP